MISDHAMALVSRSCIPRRPPQSWPKDWDVSFKLHALRQTTVECVYRSGKVESLTVTPESRRSDVEVILAASSGTDRP